ncbi:MAG: FtsX-like permease family protein, partial [Rhodobacteraceae bacterium]
LAPARPLAWLGAHERRMRAQGAAAVALLAAAALIAWRGASMAAGFAMMGALLLGAALLLPVLLGAALRWAAARARGPILGWALADARAGLSGLSLALMALMLALSANIGVGAMVGGFRLTFETWLDQRLAADFYLRAPPEQVAALEAAAAADPGVRALLPSRSVEMRVDGWPVEAQGLPPAPLFRETWPLIAALPDAWDLVAAGEGALVSEQLARRLGVGPGDRFAAPAAEGPWTLTVAGVYPDYGNPKGQIVVDHAAHLAQFPEARAGSFHLLADAAAAERLAALPEVEMIDQAGVKAFSLGLFERTFAVTAALNVLTLAVAAVALLASLAALADMRLPQLAPLWAMGVTRARLARLEMAKILGLALATALLAIPFGMALAWALVAVVNVQAFGWRLPLHAFPGEWLRLIALALAAAGLAALWPIRRLARTPPAALAQALAQDR